MSHESWNRLPRRDTTLLLRKTEPSIPSFQFLVLRLSYNIGLIHRMSAFFFKIWQCQTRSIHSGEKERTDLSGRSGRGHLVLVCAEWHRPRPLLQLNRTRTPGIVGADQILIENAEHFARIDVDLSDFEKECTQCLTSDFMTVSY